MPYIGHYNYFTDSEIYYNCNKCGTQVIRGETVCGDCSRKERTCEKCGYVSKDSLYYLFDSTRVCVSCYRREVL